MSAAKKKKKNKKNKNSVKKNNNTKNLVNSSEQKTQKEEKIEEDVKKGSENLKEDKNAATKREDNTIEKQPLLEKDNKKSKGNKKNKQNKQESKNNEKSDTTKKEDDIKEKEEDKSSVKEKNSQKDNKKEKKSKDKKDVVKDDIKKNKEGKQKKDETIDNDKPEYVQEMIKNRKRKMYILICIIVIVILLIMFSTCFAIFNLNSTTFINGVSVKNIDISGLSKEDARSRINEAINVELMAELNLKYGDDYRITLDPEQIEFQYKVEESIENAYSVGRDGNIVENNYALLLTTFFGKNITIDYTYNEDLLNQFVEDINSKLPGIVVQPTYYIEDSKLIVNKGTDGIQVKKEELKKDILKAISNRKAEEMTDDSFEQTIEISVEEVKADSIDIEKIYSEIYTEPQDAYFETDPYKIYADVDGIDLAISIEEAKSIISSEDKEEYSFDLKITKAEKTIDDLGTEAFPYLISSFSTKYDASNTNRSTNLKIAAEKINGKVLMPGEEFSFNKVVGKRTVEEGYKDAKIYADGGVVDGLAGGICQISSTLYNSVLLANLEITERRNHTYTTSYVAAGRDATVVYGTTDFKFVNSRSYPIKIEATVNNGVAEFKIHGMQEKTEYEVRILPVTTQSIPYTTQYVEDATLMHGQQVVSQSGHAGYKVTTYKELRLNGVTVSKEVISNDTYSPMKAIVRVGPSTVTTQEVPVQ